MALPTYLFFAKRKGKPKETNTKTIAKQKSNNRGDNYLTNKGRTRNKKKSFWVTEGERKAIEKIATKTGMGDGEYLRISALGKMIYQVEELKPILHELKGIGRNLNQLTMLSHQGVIRTVNLTATVETLGRCYQAINKLYAYTEEDKSAVIGSGEK